MAKLTNVHVFLVAIFVDQNVKKKWQMCTYINHVL